MEEIRITEIIKELRKEKGLSQETIAEQCGISMQAVSKWENGQSYPDIVLLPKLAQYFDVTLDYLLTGKETGKDKKEKSEEGKESIEMPEEWKKDVLYIAQCRNGKILKKDTWEKDKIISVAFEEEFKELSKELSVNIMANASISGDAVVMNASAGAGINCGDIQGDASAGAGINCGDIQGDASAGAGMNCGDIQGDASAGVSIACDRIGGDAKAGIQIKGGKGGKAIKRKRK